jgi:hypothetical protein
MPEKKRPYERYMHSIKIHLNEIWFENMDWIHLAQDRVQWQVLVNTVTSLLLPKPSENFLFRRAIITFWRSLFHKVINPSH